MSRYKTLGAQLNSMSLFSNVITSANIVIGRTFLKAGKMAMYALLVIAVCWPCARV